MFLNRNLKMRCFLKTILKFASFKESATPPLVTGGWALPLDPRSIAHTEKTIKFAEN